VHELTESAEGEAIVRALIDVWHALRAEVIGEGIETEEQVSRLRELDCDLGQGAYFPRPLSPDGMEELLARDAPLMGTNAG
jgi:diguanylate cyclase